MYRFNNIDAIKNATTKDTCGVMLEPVQGEGGVNIPDEGYLKAVRQWCDEKGILLNSGRSADRHRPNRHHVRISTVRD